MGRKVGKKCGKMLRFVVQHAGGDPIKWLLNARLSKHQRRNLASMKKDRRVAGEVK